MIAHRILIKSACLCLALPSSSSAALPASDTASAYTTATWLTGSNLGTGFGPWTIDNSLGKAIESSDTNSGTPNIGTAFRITRRAGDGGFAQVQRTFTEGGSNALQELGSGQTFRFSLDLDTVNLSASAGFWLTDGGDGERWGFQYVGGQSFLQIKVNGGAAINTEVPVFALNDGTKVAFHLGEAGAWTATVRKLGFATYTLDSDTYGTLAANPTGFRFYQAANTPNATLTHYLNDLVVMETQFGFNAWAAANDITGEAAEEDHDGDGLINGIEYALGLDPVLPNGSAGTFDGQTVTFTKGATAIANADVTYVIEESDDLGVSDPWEPVVTQAPPNAAPTITYVLPTGQPKIFVRLNAMIH